MPQVEVTDADREAAADLALAMQMEATAYVARKGKGLADEKPLTQAFARHRIAALEDAKLTAERVGDSYVEPTDWDYGAQDAVTKISRAIRTLKGSPR